MKFWFVEKTTPPPEPTQIDSYHYDMFHGGARRHGARYPLADYMLGDALDFPLSLTKNTYEIAAVFMPGLNLVVSGFVAEQLRPLPSIALLPVELEKLFSTPYEKGNFDYEPFDDEDVLFGREEHDASLVEHIGPHYEVVIPRLADVMPRFQGLVPLRMGRPGRQPVDVKVSGQLLEEHPMLWRIGIVLAHPAAEILLPHLDPDYFECTEWAV